MLRTLLRKQYWWFCEGTLLSEHEYLNVAIKKISELTHVVEALEAEEELDHVSDDKILRINHLTHSIVINTQTPNRQLWYSSTISGPQRFDYKNGEWINKKGNIIDDILKNDLH
jgi:frataxin